jgi:hypothetical protein
MHLLSLSGSRSRVAVPRLLGALTRANTATGCREVPDVSSGDIGPVIIGGGRTPAKIVIRLIWSATLLQQFIIALNAVSSELGRSLTISPPAPSLHARAKALDLYVSGSRPGTRNLSLRQYGRRIVPSNMGPDRSSAPGDRRRWHPHRGLQRFSTSKPAFPVEYGHANNPGASPESADFEIRRSRRSPWP